MELISLRPLWWLLLILLMLVGWRYSLVDIARRKKIASFVLRVLGLILLAVALCRPFAFSDSEKLHVVFLVDVSQSVDLESAKKTTADVQACIDKLNSDDSWTLFAVAGGLRPFSTSDSLKQQLADWQEQGSDDVFRRETRLSDALLKSRLAFPAGHVKRIVLFSDGQDTDNSLTRTLKQLAEENVDVRLKKMLPLQFPEASIVAIKPSTKKAFVGEVVRMAVDVTANQNTSGKLRILHRGISVQQQDVEIEPDKTSRFFFDVDQITPGESRWTAELIADEDHFPINNQRTCTVAVRGKPRILMLHEQEKELRMIERALKEQDFFVDVRGKFGLPDSIQDLIAFDAVVLADFPATSMKPRQMDLLQRYVKDFGGGLAMLGSENSFGLGGYHKTPVEDVLPLVSRFEKEKEKPSLAMMLVIDKSGSMQGMPMALARQAAKSAVELLSVRDQIGVLGFDSEPIIVNEVSSASEKDAIFANIDSFQAGGGTNMYPAMVLGKEMLEDATAKIKHMICLSDGHTQQADYESLVQEMTDSGITISTVALGEADQHLMALIAELGRGRYYETQDPTNVPQIFTKETMQASKSAIKEDLFGTVQSGDHPALAGFAEADLPFTLGYVMTQQKPTAQLLMITETGDPLLAISRFGLGTGLAYTSDLTEKWGGEWLAWGDCGKFWGQVFRGIIRKNDSEGIQVIDQVVGDRWQLDIRNINSAGEPQSQVEWELSLLDEQGKANSVEVSEFGLGRYRAAVPLRDRKNLTLRLRDPATDKIRILHYNRPYPREYSLSRALPDSVQQLATIDSSEIRSDLTPQRVRQSVAWYFYLASIVSLLLGNLIRRL